LQIPNTATGFYEYSDPREAEAAAAAEGEVYDETSGQYMVTTEPPKMPVVEELPDELARATVQLHNEIEAQRVVGPKSPQVTEGLCKDLAKKTKAMTCSLVTQISGTPEGCECQLMAKKCPPADKGMGFTGLSADTPVSLPEMDGLTVVLCMYWQWIPAGNPAAKAKATAEAAKESKRLAKQYVEAAHIYADGHAKGTADALWPATNTPYPTTAAPTTTTMPPPLPAPAPAPSPGPAPAPGGGTTGMPTTPPPTTTEAPTTTVATTTEAPTTAAPTTAAPTTAAATTAAATTAAATTGAATTGGATTTGAPTTGAPTTAAVFFLQQLPSNQRTWPWQ